MGFLFKSPFPVVELVLRPSLQYLNSSLNRRSIPPPPHPSRQPFSIFQLIVLILLLQPVRSLTLSQPSAGRFIGGEAEMGALWAACKGKEMWPAISSHAAYMHTNAFCPSFPPFIYLSDILMLWIHIGNRTEPSTDNARSGTWISSRCFERCVADCIGVHGVLTICCVPDCIDSLPWALPNSLFSSQKMAYCSA